MQHTKSQGHLPSRSGEDFKGVLPYMGVAGGHFGHEANLI